ncbi:MAG: hypothetical protein U1A77_03270 [Pirellulales bacterium]
MSGDLRPLYLFWLASGGPDEETEPPVPGGLSPWPDALVAAADFFELSEDLLTAAAELSPPAPVRQDESKLLESWVAKKKVAELRSWVARLLGPDSVGARAEILTHLREQTKEASWPAAPGQRTREQLRAREELIAEQRRQSEAQAAAAARKKYLRELAQDPRKASERARELFGQSSSQDLVTAAKLLVDLREAMGLENGDRQVRKVVDEIVAAQGKRPKVIHTLREHGLIPKKRR